MRSIHVSFCTIGLFLSAACGGDFYVDYTEPPPEASVAEEEGFPLAPPEAPAPEPAVETPPNPEPEPSVETPPAPEPEPEPECTESSTGFDIDEVSTLQDGFGLPNIRDGLSLKVDAHQTADGWRPVSVEVLVMYPTWYFDFYDDSNSLSVYIYGAATPVGQPYKVKIPITKGGLDWNPITLPAGADWSADDLNQMGAWLKFDLSEVIPVGAFVDPEYFVAVGWDDWGFPNVGYSNFELDCSANWTDGGSGAWKQNSGMDCSWPMLKIEVESLNEGSCD